MHHTHRLIPGLLAGVMLAGSAGGVFAAKNPATKAQVRTTAVVTGQVSALSATGFTLTFTPKKAGAAVKTFQVAVTAATKETATKTTTGPLTNGEYALVIGPRQGTAITARRVRFSTTAFKARALHRLEQRVRAARLRHVAGTVNLAATTATSLAVTTRAGKSLVFVINTTTKFRVNKALVTVAPTFTNGERVIVRYHRNLATKTLVARAIVVPAAKA